MLDFVKRAIAFPVVLFFCLEVLFRTVIPAAIAPKEYQYQHPPVMALAGPSGETGLYTVGRLALKRFRWHINNYGFNSSHDYSSRSARRRPCIAVIGSSYIQGFYSDVDSHFSARLESILGGSVVVYNLGTSGMPLSQAINVADFATKNFEPDLLLVEVSNGSLKQSLRNNGFTPYSEQILFKGDETEIVEASTYHREVVKDLLRKSAIIRYLIYNANVNLGGGTARPADTDCEVATNAQWSRLAAEILPRLQEAAGPIPIVLFTDGDRRRMYKAPTTVASLPESIVLAKYCNEHGIPFIDLAKAQQQAYLLDSRPLNFRENYHWNPHGVTVAVEAVAAYLKSVGLTNSNNQLRTPSLAIGDRPTGHKGTY